MSTGRVFVVTGANKGIGYGIVESLAQIVDNGIIVLTSRNIEKGEKALKEIVEKLGNDRKSEIIYHQLDITDSHSIQNLADYLQENFDGLDVLVNNAGIAYKHSATESAYKQAKDTIAVNYYGTKNVTEKLAPLIHHGGRIINVCSFAGMLKKGYSHVNVDKLVNAITEADIDEFVEDYIKTAKVCTQKDAGFPESAYQVSKAAEIALSNIQHEKYSSRGITVNSADPGYTNTDMTSHHGRQSVEEGAETPVYLATCKDIPEGKFVSHCKVVEWH